MFRIIRNLRWQRGLAAAVVMVGGLIGVTALTSQAQAADYRYPQQLVRPATSAVTQPNLTATAAQINSNVQSAYYQQRGPRWDPYYRPYASTPVYYPYYVPSPNYGYGYGYGYGYSPWYGYSSYPNVVYPYVSPYTPTVAPSILP